MQCRGQIDLLPISHQKGASLFFGGRCQVVDMQASKRIFTQTENRGALNALKEEVETARVRENVQDQRVNEGSKNSIRPAD